MNPMIKNMLIVLLALVVYDLIVKKLVANIKF